MSNISHALIARKVVFSTKTVGRLKLKGELILKETFRGGSRGRV